MTTGEGDVVARSVIFATGSSLKKLDVPGEERLTGSGVSHCATCDAPLLRGHIVPRGRRRRFGNAGSPDAGRVRFKGDLLHRDEALTGQAYYRDRVSAHAKIDIRSNTVVNEILGEARLPDCGHGRAEPAPSSDIEIAAVFAYVGLQPNTGFLAGPIDLDPAGRIPTDALTRTEIAGVFAAGNIRAHSTVPSGKRRRRRRQLPRSRSIAIWPTAHGQPIRSIKTSEVTRGRRVT